MTTDKQVKKWPKEYYASKYECSLKHLRRCNVSKAKRNGVLGWRNFSSKANVLDTVKPQA